MTRPTATTVIPPMTPMIIHRYMLDILVIGTGVLLPYLGPKIPAIKFHVFTSCATQTARLGGSGFQDGTQLAEDKLEKRSQDWLSKV